MTTAWQKISSSTCRPVAIHASRVLSVWRGMRLLIGLHRYVVMIAEAHQRPRLNSQAEDGRILTQIRRNWRNIWQPCLSQRCLYAFRRLPVPRSIPADFIHGRLSGCFAIIPHMPLASLLESHLADLSAHRSSRRGG
jgi:hypothetical protein